MLLQKFSPTFRVVRRSFIVSARSLDQTIHLRPGVLHRGVYDQNRGVHYVVLASRFILFF